MTTPTTTRSSGRGFLSAAATAVGAAVVAVLAHLLWLGWHTPKELDPATLEESGPYEPWQVVAVVLTLGVVVALGAWFRRPLAVVAGTVLGITGSLAADWATAPDADGLWIIGAGLVAVGSAVGASALAAVVLVLRQRTDSRR